MTPLWALAVFVWIGVSFLVHVRLEEDGRMWNHRWLAIVSCLLWPVMLFAQPVAEEIALAIYRARVRFFTWRVERELRRLIAGTPSALLSDPERALLNRNVNAVVQAMIHGRAPDLTELLDRRSERADEGDIREEDHT